MARNSAEQHREVSEPLNDNRDSQSITELIKQLDRDFEETHTKAARES